jgi:hypothetical protein
MDFKFDILLRAEYLEQPIPKFEAIISEQDKNKKSVDARTFPKYLRIPKAGEPYVVLKSNPRKSGNDSIFISSAWDFVKGSKDYGTASKKDFFWFRMSHDSSQRLAAIGLLLALAGAVIDGFFAAGKFWPIFYVPDYIAGLTSVFTMLLKVVGLWLAFKKGFWDAK